MIGIAVNLMYYVYLFITKTALDIFNCKVVYSEDGVTDGYQYLAAESSLRCYEEGGVQQTLVWPAVFAFCLYGIGYPVLMCWVFFKKRHREKIHVDQLPRACNTGGDYKTNPECY